MRIKRKELVEGLASIDQHSEGSPKNQQQLLGTHVHMCLVDALFLLMALCVYCTK